MTPKAITFDYFGTLVDVDQGGTAGIAAILAETRIQSSRSNFDIYVDWNVRNVQLYRGGRYRSYRSVSRDAMAATLNALQPRASDEFDLEGLTELFLGHLAESAPPHPEVPAVLDWLAARFPLMPITNMDNDLWQRSRLARYFDQVTTAEMARAYKPSEAIFKLAIDRLGVAAEDVLHCSLASWADLDGAKPLGVRVAWINRTNESLSKWQPRPDYEFPTLDAIREILP